MDGRRIRLNSLEWISATPEVLVELNIFSLGTDSPVV